MATAEDAQVLKAIPGVLTISRERGGASGLGIVQVTNAESAIIGIRAAIEGLNTYISDSFILYVIKKAVGRL